MESHLITVKTSHEAVKQCVVVRNFLGRSWDWWDFPTAHCDFAYFGKELGSDYFNDL